jgi:hypothetical protein
MSCHCKPTQKEPHIFKGAAHETYFLTIPYKFKLPYRTYSVLEFYKTGKKNWKTVSKFKITRRLVLLQLTRNIKPPKDCNEKDVPIREWELGWLKFGKIIK